MLSMFFGGQLRTMEAHYRIDAGDLRVIFRPFIYVRERVLAAGVSFLAAIVLGSRMIAWLNRRFREPIGLRLRPKSRIPQHKQWSAQRWRAVPRRRIARRDA